MISVPVLVLLACQLSGEVTKDPATQKLIDTVRAVGPKGENHQAAVDAATKLQKSDVKFLAQVVVGLDGANPLAENWLRGIAESIATRSEGKLPVADLETVLSDTSHSPHGRRLAYEMIASVDASAEKRLIPPLVNDPSLELRRDAVQLLIDEANALISAEKKSEAAKVYGQAFAHARSITQVKSIAAKLKELEQPIDMPSHLGFIITWNIIGPFENGGDKGWDVAYPPENGIDLAAELPGQKGNVKWISFSTTEEFGEVDLTKALDKHKGAIAYAATTFVSERDQTVDIRLGCINASKVWVNGDLIASNHVYHSGMEIDQYIGQAKLKKGKNEILVKVCQNEQTEMWAQRWQFQLRVCDSLGGAILSQDRIVPKTASK